MNLAYRVRLCLTNLVYSNSNGFLTTLLEISVLALGCFRWIVLINQRANISEKWDSVLKFHLFLKKSINNKRERESTFTVEWQVPLSNLRILSILQKSSIFCISAIMWF